MKEATGEASLTVVTIVLIAAVLGAASVILNYVMTKTVDKAKEATDGTDGTVSTINYVIDLD